MQAIETEVKISVADCEDFEQRLPRLGFAQITGRTFERNTLYDTPERTLRNSHQILRLRQYGDKWTVTRKEALKDEGGEERHKRRIETETAIEDGPALGKIFEGLGLRPVFIYEKWRTEWADREGHCVVDETPLGAYAEIEGPSEWIDATARRLHVSESEFIKLSYGRIFETWRERSGSQAAHFTFVEIPPGSRAFH